jgi:hypothetical protein
VKEFQRNGDDMTFIGPGPKAAPPNGACISTPPSSNRTRTKGESVAVKGTIKSSWLADGQKIERTPPVEPPFELNSNGLSQDCYGFWDQLKEVELGIRESVVSSRGWGLEAGR